MAISDVTTQGDINIKFDPPNVLVPSKWKDLFSENYLSGTEEEIAQKEQ